MTDRRLLLLLLLLALLPSPVSAQSPPPPPERGVQGFLDALPGPLKTYQDGGQSAASWIETTGGFYGLNPRLMLALLEATGTLLSDPQPPVATLQSPFGANGPAGFGAQLSWAARELRAGFGPYERPPTLRFTDGTTATLTLQQAPEGLAVQRLLAQGRTRAEWLAVNARFDAAFQRYFQNRLPPPAPPAPAGAGLTLQRPWPAGTAVTHLAYFDHMYPTVDTGRRDNGFVVTYRGRGDVEYDGHDGHDYFFPQQPIGTRILAAADGTAFASTVRGNGVWIRHANGYETVYWHLDAFAQRFRGLVNTGKGVAVKAGDPLGTSGRSGFSGGTPHLHFEVRLNGRETDPYGWYGPGADPCLAYAGCAASAWLWSPSLIGELDFTPPAPTGADRTPPEALLTLDPDPDLLLQAELRETALQRVGAGWPSVGGAPQWGADGVTLGPEDRLRYPTERNILPEAGTIALQATLPRRYPADAGPFYLLAASASPDGGPRYAGTLALRRDERGWNFWTTPNDDGPRSDLTVPDDLAPGPHHFAISWERAGGVKRLYVDGALVAEVRGAALPVDIGPQISLGRYSPGMGTGGAALRDLRVYRRALLPAEIAALAEAPAAPPVVTARTSAATVRLSVAARDADGPIVAVQIGVNGVWSDPQPYERLLRLTLPASAGPHLIAARVYDRAGNSATVTASVERTQSPNPVSR